MMVHNLGIMPCVFLMQVRCELTLSLQIITHPLLKEPITNVNKFFHLAVEALTNPGSCNVKATVSKLEV